VRIAQVVPKGEQPWSGVLTVIVHLAAALARRHHHVEVWQLHEWTPDDYAEQRQRLEVAGVVQVPLPGSRRSGRTAATLAEERSIYVFSPHSGYDPVSLRRSRVRKSLYRILLERTMLAHAALLVALTDIELGQLRDIGAPGPFAVIPNGVESPPDDLDRRAFRRELGILPETPLAVFVGRLDVHRKGLDVLVRGIAGAPMWHLALIGPRFRDVDRLEEIINRLGVGERVHLVGERHGRRLLEGVGAADVFALMSRWEGLPMALLEALSLSTPAIVSSAVERLIGVEAAGAGWAVADEDLGPLLRRLQGEGRDEVPRLGRAALELSRRYDWDSVAKEYETVYERIGARHRG
jgi:glycosyltransferase involved in cell wall biosynthesis